MEQFIGPIITGGVVMALIGIIYHNLTSKIKELDEKKVDYKPCEITHKEADRKFEALFKKLDQQHDMLTIISENTKGLKKHDDD